MLLLAALTTGLNFLQAEPEAQPKTQAQLLTESLAAVTTPEALWAWEREIFYPRQRDLSDTERVQLARGLARQYEKVGKVASGYSQSLPVILARYQYGHREMYQNRDVIPALHAFFRSIGASKTKEELATLVEGYFSKNWYPETLEGFDSRVEYPSAGVRLLATASIRLGAPDALNWALVYYRIADLRSPRAVEESINIVATALKATDFNITRANAWVEGQNTGVPAVEFTNGEQVLPKALSGISAFSPILDTPLRFVAAKEQYRTAKTSAQVDMAIYRIANVLKAHDLNLVRANAWIEAQKSGTTFDLALEK